MPGGIPVATCAIGKAGATNAALFAAAPPANEDAALADRLVAWRETQTNSVAPVPVREGGYREPYPGSTNCILGDGQFGRLLGPASAQRGSQHIINIITDTR